MKLCEITTPSLRPVDRQFNLLASCRADDSDFCRDTTARGWLTEAQMTHAAERYMLGKSRSGKCIFWMIDELGMVRDGHLGNSWVSSLLKQREPELLRHYHPTHCLFGLHLWSENMPICVVESEASAVILSELFPESLWLAYVSASHLTPDLFAPLEGRKVTIYPRTDDTMSTYLFFLDFADQLRRHLSLDLHIDSTLEDHATADQKSRGIDLVDFIFNA